MLMQYVNLPVSIKAELDKICKRFIWSGANQQQKLSLVNWEMVCQPKDCGGLGLKNLDLMNKAMLMVKYGMRLCSGVTYQIRY